MTRSEWNNLNKRELSNKAISFLEQSDQYVYELVNHLDITDISGINKVLEDNMDAYDELESEEQ